jgi:hypothetical protein
MPFETGITGHLVRQHHLGGQRSRGEYAKSGLFGRVGHPQARVRIIKPRRVAHDVTHRHVVRPEAFHVERVGLLGILKPLSHLERIHRTAIAAMLEGIHRAHMQLLAGRRGHLELVRRQVSHRQPVAEPHGEMMIRIQRHAPHFGCHVGFLRIDRAVILDQVDCPAQPRRPRAIASVFVLPIAQSPRKQSDRIRGGPVLTHVKLEDQAVIITAHGEQFVLVGRASLVLVPGPQPHAGVIIVAAMVVDRQQIIGPLRGKRHAGLGGQGRPPAARIVPGATPLHGFTCTGHVSAQRIGVVAPPDLGFVTGLQGLIGCDRCSVRIADGGKVHPPGADLHPPSAHAPADFLDAAVHHLWTRMKMHVNFGRPRDGQRGQQSGQRHGPR